MARLYLMDLFRGVRCVASCALLTWILEEAFVALTRGLILRMPYNAIWQAEGADVFRYSRSTEEVAEDE
jgi:hypothetical protein